MPHAGGPERARNVCPFGRRRNGEALAQPAAAGIDAELAPSFRVDEPEQPDIRELLLARIADLDRDDVVMAGELQ